MKVIGNKYVKGVTQFVQAEHFGCDSFIDWHRATMGMSVEEYTAFFLSESNNIKTFEQFSLNEEDKSRSDGFIPGRIKRDIEGLKADTEISIDALDYSKAGKDDLVVCYAESSDDMLRLPKMAIELEDGEGV